MTWTLVLTSTGLAGGPLIDSLKPCAPFIHGIIVDEWEPRTSTRPLIAIKLR
jgi:hypothetical protein